MNLRVAAALAAFVVVAHAADQTAGIEYYKGGHHKIVYPGSGVPLVDGVNRQSSA